MIMTERLNICKKVSQYCFKILTIRKTGSFSKANKRAVAPSGAAALFLRLLSTINSLKNLGFTN